MEELIHRFEQTLKNQEKYFFDSHEFIDIIWYYYYEGEMPLFSKALKMGLEQHPNCIEIHIAKAEYYIYNENYYRALALCENILEKISDTDEKKEEVLYMMVDIYSNLRQFSKATSVLMQIKEITKDVSSVKMSLGNVYLYQNDYKKALKYFKEVYESGDDSFFAFNDMVVCYNELKKHQELRKYLYEEVKKRPYHLFAWEEIGMQCIELGDFEEALEAFETAIAIDDGHDPLYIKKAEILEKLGHFKEAIDSYSEVTHQEMLNDGTIDASIANCYKKMKQYDKAVELYKKAAEKDPANEEFWLELIHINYLANDMKTAEKYVKKTLEIDDENPKYLRMGYLVFFSLDKYDIAEQLIAKAVKYDPEDMDSWLKLMDTNFVLQNTIKSQKIALEASKRFENIPDISYRLAGYYILNHQIEIGLVLLSQTFEKFPEQKDIFTFFFPMLTSEIVIKKILKEY